MNEETAREGIINFLKPAGMTSHDGVGMLRRLTGIKRIGHTGTLDPMAVGVLPLCIGSSTRIMEYLELDQKSYRCELQMGLETDTLDIWGTVISDRRAEAVLLMRENLELVKDAFRPFEGEILQYPPQYSAVRVDGRRMYEYARQGKTVEVQPRPVTIHSLNLVSFDEERARILFDVSCSKGTYIRTICADVGRALGVGGAMSFLCRTASGSFRLEDTVTMELLNDLEKDSETGRVKPELLQQYLLPPDFPLIHFGEMRVNEDRGKWFANGGKLRMEDCKLVKQPEFLMDMRIDRRYRNAYKVYSEEAFLGIAIYDEEEKRLTADKVFFR